MTSGTSRSPVETFLVLFRMPQVFCTKKEKKSYIFGCLNICLNRSPKFSGLVKQTTQPDWTLHCAPHNKDLSWGVASLVCSCVFVLTSRHLCMNATKAIFHLLYFINMSFYFIYLSYIFNICIFIKK